jgi:transposase
VTEPTPCTPDAHCPKRPRTFNTVRRRRSGAISAIRCAGVIERAALTFDGATNATIFRGYVERCPAPALKPGEIVVMGNLSSHKVRGVREAIESVGSDLWYLPPYSPDMNPIGKLWSKVKAHAPRRRRQHIRWPDRRHRPSITRRVSG